MNRSRRKIFSILFSIFAVTFFAFLITGCRNKNIQLRDEVIAKATVFIQDNVEFGINSKSESDIELGKSYVVANPEIKEQIKAAINSLKTIPEKELKKSDIDALTSLINNLVLIKGNAKFYKVTFEPNGGSTTAPLEQRIKTGEKINNAPTLTYEGHKFIGWELNGEIIDLTSFVVSKDITLVAQWEKGNVYYKITLDDSVKDLFSLEDSSVNLNQLQENQVVKFTITPKEHTKIKLFFNEEEQVVSADNKYQVKVTKNLTIKVVVENITFKLTINDDKNKLTHNITDLNNILEGTKVVLQLGSIEGHQRVLKVNNEEINESQIIDSKYEFTITKNTVVELLFTKLANLSFDKNIIGYLEIVEPSGLDLTKTYFVKPNTELKFKIKNIPENKEIEEIKLGAQNIEVNSDPNFVYSIKLLIGKENQLTLSLKPKTFMFNFTAVPEFAKSDVKFYEQGTTNEIDITKPIEYGKKITIKRISPYPTNMEFECHIDGVVKTDEVIAGYNLDVYQNYTIQVKRKTFYKLTIDATSRQYLNFISTEDIPDNAQVEYRLEENKDIGFKLRNLPIDKKVSKISVGGNILDFVSNPNHIYEGNITKDTFIQIELKTKTHKVNVNATPLSCLEYLKIYKYGTTQEVDITEELEYGTKITFKLSDTIPVGTKLQALFNDVDHSEDIKTGYDVEVKETLNISINQISSTTKYDFSIEEQARDYVEIIAPATIDKTTVNKIEENTRVRFKIKNLPVGKEIDQIQFGSKTITVQTDPEYVYSGTVSNNTILNVTLKAKTYNITFNANPENAVGDLKFYKKDTVEEIDINSIAHGTKITIKRINNFSLNYRLTVLVGGNDISSEVVSGYNLTVNENITIDITKVAIAVTVNLKLNGAKLFDAGFIGDQIYNYATKLATLNGKTITYGDKLEFDYFFYKDNRHCFENFLIEETNEIINIGDQVPNNLIKMTLIPQFKAGYYREDTLNKVFYMYKTIGTGKFELVRLGNFKQSNSDEYTQCNTLTIPPIEYTGTGVEQSYKVKSIAKNATNDLRKVKKIDFYGDNKLEIEIIGDNNFNNISSLEYFLLSTKIKHIGSNTLLNCPNLKKVVKNNVIYLDNDTTESHCYLVAIGVQNKNATEITLHKNTRIILHGAFNSMTELTKVVLNKNLKQIGNEAFKDCTKLNTINLSEATNLKTIGKHAFISTLITKEYITTNVVAGCQVDIEVC